MDPQVRQRRRASRWSRVRPAGLLRHCVPGGPSLLTNGLLHQAYAETAQRWTYAQDGTLRINGRCLDIVNLWALRVPQSRVRPLPGRSVGQHGRRRESCRLYLRRQQPRFLDGDQVQDSGHYYYGPEAQVDHVVCWPAVVPAGIALLVRVRRRNERRAVAAGIAIPGDLSAPTRPSGVCRAVGVEQPAHLAVLDLERDPFNTAAMPIALGQPEGGHGDLAQVEPARQPRGPRARCLPGFPGGSAHADGERPPLRQRRQ